MPRILVVDDSLLARESVARILRREGYATTTAANGKEAWMMLYAGAPDLIVLDLMMPQMSGLTFLRMLRQHHHWNGVPVLILTGHADQEQMLKQARALGVADFIFKGIFAIDQLLACVRNLVPVGKQREVAFA